MKLNKEYDYDHFIKDTEKIANNYKELIKLSTIGRSHDDRVIPMFKLGVNKKGIVITGGVHARETINTVVLMKIIEEYCNCYNNKKLINNYNVYDILNNVSFYFIPLLNPDGYVIALKGFDMIKKPLISSLQINNSKDIKTEIEWKYNARGIDINRNFPAKSWKEKFVDDKPATEKETIALMKVFNNIPTLGYLDFHSRGREIYYYRHAMSKEYNDIQYQLASLLSKESGYTLVEPELETLQDDSGGNTVQYYSENFIKPALTIETTPNEAVFPLDYKYQQEVYDEIISLPLVFANELLKINL